MKVLVTGGAGYIGSHAVRALAKRGHAPIIYDNLSRGHRGFADGFELIAADLNDSDQLPRALRRVDAVMHFAALAYVGESVLDPQLYFGNNVVSGLRLLDAAVAAGVHHFVFSSTCAVYGEPTKLPLTEDLPREPINPYGASKLFIEHALEAYERAYGLTSVRLRYFNAAGADEQGMVGEWHEPETHLIPLALQAAAGTGPELQIFGNDYPTPDGTCIRDYIDVNDLADAHVAAIEYLERGGPGVALNLGTGRGYSVKEIVDAVTKITGRNVPHRYAPRRPGDPPILIADPSRANTILGFQPKRSLDDMVRNAWNYLVKRATGESPPVPIAADLHGTR